MPSSLPINPNVQDGETSVNIYGYTPWLSLGIFSCILFGICLIAHIGYAIYAGTRKEKKSFGQSSISAEKDLEKDQIPLQEFSRRKSKQIVTFETLFSFGCALEVIGYANRTVSSKNPFILVNFILNYFMIVVAPVFFSAAQYYCLSILLQKCKEWKKFVPFKGKTIVKIFVIADIFTILMQVIGAALIGVSESNLAQGLKPPLQPEQANDILRAGLAIQVFSITIFLTILFLLIFKLFQNRYQANTIQQSRKNYLILTILTISTLFIYIRTVYRLIEAALGVESGPTLNQPLFAALETVPVFIAVILWTILPLQSLL